MILSLILTLSLLGGTFSADILAVFPHTGKSHFDVFEPLVLALARRGHSLTVLSFFPQKTPVPNFSDISLVGVAPIFVETLKFEYLKGMNSVKDFIAITAVGVESCDSILNSQQVRNLVNTIKTYDLIIIEAFNTDCFLGLVDVFKVPYIGISSSSYLPTLYPRLGSFDNPAYIPNLFFPFTSRMSFFQRVVNTMVTPWMRLVRTHHLQPQERRALKKAFGLEVDVESVSRNMSLVLVNTHHSLQGARPLPPGFVEVGGLHISHSKPLSEVRVLCLL